MASMSALVSLAQYGSSDSEITDSEVEDILESTDVFILRLLKNVVKESVRRVEYARSIKYRNQDEIDLVDSSSSSDDESSDDDDDSSDFEGLIFVNNKEASEKAKKVPPRVKGELLPTDLPPIEDLHISVPAYECLQIGQVSSIVDQMVVVQSAKNSPALDLDTVLFLENGGRPLGKIFDVMGPVVQPFYCVRFNSVEHVREKRLEVGMPVFFAPRTEHTSFIFLAELLNLKGSDASWENDNEPPPSHLDYSDDEKERHAKRSYLPPTDQARQGNAFYRKERQYKPRNHGPIQWNSSHVAHLS